MAVVVIQQGHVPRRTGRTGTYREQEFVRTLAPEIAARLTAVGHIGKVIGADDEPCPPCSLFVALHTDGSANKARRGASVGYPDDNGAKLARAWKRAHQRNGFPGGFLPDNYTPDLRGYYYFNDAAAAGARYRFLAEHGTTTNAADEAWLFSHVEQCAQAHVDAITEILGAPAMPDPTSGWPKDHFVIGASVPGGRPDAEGQLPYWILDDAGGVWSCNGAQFYGSVPGVGVNLPAAGIAAVALLPTPSGRGYLVVDERGGAYAFGDAVYRGSIPERPEHGQGKRFVGATWSPGGYTLLADNEQTYAMPW